ncbi:hypothetical protein BDW62DRAFT_157256 [Aspergillus aurantiobrunneus]
MTLWSTRQQLTCRGSFPLRRGYKPAAKCRPHRRILPPSLVLKVLSFFFPVVAPAFHSLRCSLSSRLPSAGATELAPVAHPTQSAEVLRYIDN